MEKKVDCIWHHGDNCMKGLPGTICDPNGCAARMPQGTAQIVNQMLERAVPIELTWQDIKAIVNIADSLLRVTEREDHFLINSRFPTEESYYKAVLEEFNKTRTSPEE